MPQTLYRANLRAASFPLISTEFGRSVIIGQLDQTTVRFLNAQRDLGRDIEAPQIYYCHNMMPSVSGIQSIGYAKVLTELSAGEVNFTEVFTLRDQNEGKVYFSRTSDGRNFVSAYPYYNWVETTTIVTPPDCVITLAYIAGKTYIYFAGVGCYLYNTATNVMGVVTLTGTVAANILGITASSGYMIAYTATAIAWSSVVSETDFTPSDITGAGGGSIAQARGGIVACSPTEYGFLIFTTRNAIAASYSGNSAFPFNYEELTSSGGLASLHTLSRDSNSATIYAYTTNGLQEFIKNRVSTIKPEITDFISGHMFEDFNEQTMQFEYTELESATMHKHIRLISDRYLVISYGLTELTHALVYDLVLDRLGKLRVPHVDCFEWSVLSPTVTETPRNSIAFLSKSGAVKLVDFNAEDTYSEGLVILGKYQLVRSRMLSLSTAYIENIPNPAKFDLYSFGELLGKEAPTPVKCTYIKGANGGRLYGINKTFKNHSLILKGGFQLMTLELSFNPGGIR